MIRRKKKSPEEIAENKKNIERRNTLFFKVWNSRERKCYNCGCLLHGELKSYYVDHVLEKSQYPELEFEEDNLGLICFPCHQRKSNGYLSPKMIEVINKVKQLFNIN